MPGSQRRDAGQNTESGLQNTEENAPIGRNGDYLPGSDWPLLRISQGLLRGNVHIKFSRIVDMCVAYSIKNYKLSNQYPASEKNI